MKILIVFRRRGGDYWEDVKIIQEGLKKMGHSVDLLSREDDLNIGSLSSSMNSLPLAISKKDKENNYDRIYTQDWSIAFPLVFPTKTLSEKHYSFFHNVEPSGAKSRILQRIAGNILGNKLIVKNEELKKRFPKSFLSNNGIVMEIFK